MNQRWAENHYRAFPLVDDAVAPFGNALLVDLQVRLHQDLAVWGAPLQLFCVAVQASGSSGVIRFSLPLPGRQLFLEGTFSTTALEDTVIPLVLKDLAGTSQAGLGHGWAVIGVPARSASFTGSLACAPECLRPMPSGDVLQLSVANLARPRPSLLLDGTQQELDPVQFTQVVTKRATSDIEATTLPTPQQAVVAAECDYGVTMEDVVADVNSQVQVSLGEATTVSVTSSTLSLNDTIPAAQHAATLVGPCSRALLAGLNCRLTGVASKGQVRLGFRLGAGAGWQNCAGIAGYEAQVLAGECVRAINGQTGLDGDVQIECGAGVSLVRDPVRHTLNIVLKP